MEVPQTVITNPAAEAGEQMVAINPASESQILGFDDLDQEIPQESRIPELPVQNSPDFPIGIAGVGSELGQISDQGDFEVGDEAAADGRPHVNPVSVFRTNGFPQLPRRPDPNLPMQLQNMQDPLDRLQPELIPLPRPQDPYNPSRVELRQYISASNKRIMQLFEANNLTFSYLLRNQKKFGYSLTFHVQPRYLSLVSSTVQLLGLLAVLASIQYDDKKWMVLWVAGDFLANLVIGFIRATSALDIFPFSKMESLILILQVIPQVGYMA